jgi:hypothetical protein
MDAAAKPRKLRISDVMILLAGAAAGMSLARYYLTSPSSFTPLFENGVASMGPGFRPWSVPQVATVGSLILAALTPTFLWVGLRVQQSRIRAIVRQPGFLGCIAATAAVAFYFGRHLFPILVNGWPMFVVPANFQDGTSLASGLDLFALQILPPMRWHVGPFVVAAWLALALTGQWRRTADWPDRTGLILGIAWIAVYLPRLS